MEERNEELFSKDAETRRLQQAFGEALGDLATPEDTQEAWGNFLAKQERDKRRRWIRIYSSGAAAAVVALFLIVGFVYRQTVPGEIEVFAALDVPERTVTTEIEGRIIVATPPATTSSLLLEDGTRILLSANSRLEYPKHFSRTGKRSVKLIGEARFEVAKDPARPFIVSSGKMQTEVLGTVFDVNVYPGSETSSVTLYQGHVRVCDEAVERDMLPGQQVVQTGDKGLNIRKAPATATEGWANGEFFFDDTSLNEVMQAIGTWYNVSIVFISSDLLHQRIHFRFTREASLQEIVQALNDLGIARLQQEKGKLFVKSRFTKD